MGAEYMSWEQSICYGSRVYDMGAECEARYKEVRYAEGGAVW